MTNLQKGAMLAEFKSLGKPALSMNHYDLATISEAFSNAEDWREFLLDPQTLDYIKKEMDVIRKAELNKLQKDAASSRSVGQAQLLNSLAKLEEANEETPDGPVFIYCYVPLNDEQKNAPNVMEVDEYGKFIT